MDEYSTEDIIADCYDDGADLAPRIDPYMPEGAAIIDLYRRIKNLTHDNHEPSGADVLSAVNHWFTELGIDIEASTLDIARQLRETRLEMLGGNFVSSTFGARIDTKHRAPEPILRATLKELARKLGHGTSIELIDVSARESSTISGQP